MAEVEGLGVTPLCRDGCAKCVGTRFSSLVRTFMESDSQQNLLRAQERKHQYMEVGAYSQGAGWITLLWSSRSRVDQNQRFHPLALELGEYTTRLQGSIQV